MTGGNEGQAKGGRAVAVVGAAGELHGEVCNLLEGLGQVCVDDGPGEFLRISIERDDAVSSFGPISLVVAKNGAGVDRDGPIPRICASRPGWRARFADWVAASSSPAISGWPTRRREDAERLHRVLLVEDDPADAKLVEQFLRSSTEDRFELTVEASLAAAIEQIPRAEYSVIVADLALPDAEGRKAVSALREAAAELPIVVLTGSRDPGLERAILGDGAQDYLCKVGLDGASLVRSIVHATIRQRRRRELERLAHRDPLTRVANRLGFQAFVERRITAATRDDRTFALLLLDLDGFKRVNDTYGHAAGDEILRRTTAAISAQIRDGDFLARLGGDEFAIVLERESDLPYIEAIARRLVESPRLGVRGESGEVVATISLGIALFPDHGRELPKLLAAADSAMYTAKMAGKNTWHLYVEPPTPRDVGDVASSRISPDLESTGRIEMLEAPASDLSIEYQPRVDLATGCVSAFEALLRPKHTSPIAYVAQLELRQEIHGVGLWILNQVCARRRELERDGFGDLRMAINVSAAQFAHPDFGVSMTKIMDAHGLGAGQLQIEVTQSAMMTDDPAGSENLRCLHGRGVSIALDRFGTRGSALSDLQNLSIDAVKIDRAFVSGSADRSRVRSITKTIVELGHELDLEVVAQGVETLEELARIRAMGCTVAQGFLFARPEADWPAARIDDVEIRAGEILRTCELFAA